MYLSPLTRMGRWLERPWAFFGMAALTLLMFSIDSTIVAVALPTLVADLDTTLVWAGWTLTAYALTQTVMMPLAGKLAEQFGQMRVFLICVLPVHARLAAVRAGPEHLRPDRLPRHAGDRRRRLLPGRAPGIVAEQFPRDAQPDDRPVRLDLPDRRHPRPEPRRRHHRAFWLARDLPDQRARSASWWSRCWRQPGAWPPARPCAGGASARRAASTCSARSCSPRSIVGLLMALTLLGDDPALITLADLLADGRRERRAARRCSSGRSAAPPTRSST